MDTSLRDEIIVEGGMKKSRLRYYIAASFVLLALATTGIVTALNGRNNANDSKPHKTTSSDQAGTLSVVTGDPVPGQTSNPEPTPVQTPTPKPTQASAPVVDEAASKAKVCKSVIDNAKQASDNYNKMYFDSWNTWNTTYYGAYDSPDAIENKNWYKNYIKGLYNDFINANNGTYLSVCGNGGSVGSVADVLYQPNYDAW